jgi:excisionase family DNA binding protein
LLVPLVLTVLAQPGPSYPCNCAAHEAPQDSRVGDPAGFGPHVQRPSRLTGANASLRSADVSAIVSTQRTEQGREDALTNHLMEEVALLTAEQVAERLGCEVQTVNEKAAAHQLPAVKYGRSWRFPVEALNQHLAEQALEHVSQRRRHPKSVPVASPASGRPDLTILVRVVVP